MFPLVHAVCFILIRHKKYTKLVKKQPKNTLPLNGACVFFVMRIAELVGF